MMTLLLGMLAIAAVVVISILAIAALVILETMEKGLGDDYINEE